MTPEPLTSINPLRKLTAQEFIDIITSEDNERYPDFFESRGSFDKALILKDIEVTEIVLFDNIFFSLPITLSGVFNNITFFDCTILEEFIIRSGTFYNFKVERSNFQQDFRIEDGDFKLNFSIEKVEFFQNFHIGGGNFQRYFEIRGGRFGRLFSINGGNFSQFLINDGYFQNKIIISGGSYQHKLKICGGYFDELFNIVGGNYQQGIEIEGGWFTNFSVDGGNFGGEFLITGGYIFDIFFKSIQSKITLSILQNSQINYLSFNETIPRDSLIRISTKIYRLFFKNVQNFGTIILNDFTYRDSVLLLENVTILDDSIRNHKNPEICIQNSDLGKMIFINSDLSKFGLFFDSSKITDVFVTGTQMPNEITTEDHKQKQLGYSQIKKIYEARGDRIEANRYYAKEMEAYQTTLSWKKWDDFWEKLNLSLNKYSTNYGQSWQRGLGTTLLISGIFYALYCCFLGYLPALPTGDNFNLFSHVASYYLEFLNPIHKADYVAEQLMWDKVNALEKKSILSGQISGWARITEGISRIFITYFVFQFVQAFRKHGKSGG